MTFPPPIESFWRVYLATRAEASQPRLDPDPVRQAGDTLEVATRVGRLEDAGIKTATSGLVWEMEHVGTTPPRVGDLAIVADGAGEPLCIIEIIEVASLL